jgi:hypothetical protein
MGLAQRLIALAVVVAAAFGFAGVARTTTITGYEPGGGAAVFPLPTFAISAPNQNSGDDSFVISVTADPTPVGGELRGGYSLTISASGGSVQLPASLDAGIPFVVGSSPAPASPASSASSNSPPASTSAASAPSTASPASTPVTSSPSTPLSMPAPVASSSPPARPAKPPARASSDKKDPVVSAFAGSGTLLHSLRLRFRVSDDSGKAAFALGLYKGNRTITWRTIALKPVSARRTYFLTWKPQLLGDYLFCVGAADAAGNRRSDCAKVTIHR